MNSPNSGSRNRLLAALSHADRDLLTHALETVDLDVHQVLEAPNEPVSHAYFIESGIVSVVAAVPPNDRMEVGMIGYEGMTGLCIVLGEDRSANETLVQSSGSAMGLSNKSLREMMDASRTLTLALLRYVNVSMVQGSQTALANGRGRLDERLARWLLMWDDRIRPHDITVTHEFLALLLGVARPGLTHTMHQLEAKGLVRTTRSLIQVLNRDGLRLAANGFYGVSEAEYDRIIGVEPWIPTLLHRAAATAQ
jgi:CRP-like cAMP-binding protein